MIVQLVLRGSKNSGKVINVHGEHYVIGRSHDCNLKIKSGALSRHHAAIEIHNRIVTIQDLGSTNGTYLNGRKISDVMGLHDTDLLRMGPLDVQVRITVHRPANGSNSTLTLDMEDTNAMNDSDAESAAVDVDLSDIFEENSAEKVEAFKQSISFTIEKAKEQEVIAKNAPPQPVIPTPEDLNSREAASKALQAMFRNKTKK